VPDTLFGRIAARVQVGEENGWGQVRHFLISAIRKLGPMGSAAGRVQSTFIQHTHWSIAAKVK